MSDKPKKKTRSYYDYDEIIDYIEKKYKIDVRDYANSVKHNIELTKKFVNETGIKVNGDTKFTSPEYLKFLDWVKTNKFEVDKPYLDFWHWLIDHFFNGAGTGSVEYLPVNKDVVKESYPDAPDWVLEIFGYLEKEFGDLAKKEDEGRIPVMLDW
jgi:hypothetical protein